MTSNRTSTLTHLECSKCGECYSPDEIQTFCPDCNAPLLARYDLKALRQQADRDEIGRRPGGMWRWGELLPVREAENIVHLGEGDTALLSVPNLGEALGLNHLYVKDESTNPTGTFKARGMAAAVSKAKELGVEKVIIPTAGNAGGATAAYTARAGMRSLITMPEDTPRANIIESQMAGAEVVLVEGLISDAAAIARARAATEGWFDLSTFKEPYRVEGKKIMGCELAETFSWTLPDVIIYPTGGGTGLVGMWKAFAELEALGWLEEVKRPRMVAVQSAGCAPVVRAFEAGADSSEFWVGAQTIASGLQVPKSFADALILEDLRQSHGTAVAVSDETILEAQHKLGRLEGIFAAPEGAATLAALEVLIGQGWVRPEERIVLFNTGTGLKYLD
ncbi:MAG: threonine synthase [Anaerolineales bacterium]|jgi:threonine synthase